MRKPLYVLDHHDLFVIRRIYDATGVAAYYCEDANTPGFYPMQVIRPELITTFYTREDALAAHKAKVKLLVSAQDDIVKISRMIFIAENPLGNTAN